MSETHFEAPRLHPLREAGKSGNDGRLVEELRKLRLAQPIRWELGDYVLQILGDTRSNRVRNAAAIAAADTNVPGARETLLGLLRRQDTIGSRGTLLYALEMLKATIPLEILVGIISDDNYESRESAGVFIRTGKYDSGNFTIAAARQYLKVALAGADQERTHSIKSALHYLSGRRQDSN